MAIKLKEDKTGKLTNTDTYVDKYVNNKAGNTPSYSAKYETDRNSALSAYVDREDFSYNAASDPLYQQYKNLYTANGNKAMRDTMGNATALSGGYGNSYAQTAGQQTFNDYMTQLSDKSLDLYDRAYNQYQDAGDKLLNNYNLYATEDDSWYDRYLDQLNQYNTNRNYYTDRANTNVGNAQTERNYGYQVSQDKLSQDNYLNEIAYQKQRDNVSDTQYQSELNYQKQRDAVSDSQWNKEYNISTTKNSTSSAKSTKEKEALSLADIAKTLPEIVTTNVEMYAGGKTDKELATLGTYLDNMVGTGQLTDEQVYYIIYGQLGLTYAQAKKLLGTTYDIFNQFQPSTGLK